MHLQTNLDFIYCRSRDPGTEFRFVLFSSNALFAVDISLRERLHFLRRSQNIYDGAKPLIVFSVLSSMLKESLTIFLSFQRDQKVSS